MKDFELIKKLPYKRVEWIAEMVLFFIFCIYAGTFWFVFLGDFYNGNFPVLIFQITTIILSLLFLMVIIPNWLLRPKDKEDEGNCLERIRICIMGNKLKATMKL